MSSPDFQCLKCEKVISLEQYDLNRRFCPSCGSRSFRRLKYWIFQFSPTIYAWFDWIKEDKQAEQWLASQYAREIHKGDKVVIWASGEKAGVYALGEIVENPRITPLNTEQTRYWVKDAEADVNKFQVKKSVVVRYLKVITNDPVLEVECLKDRILLEMGILKQSQGTNFPITNEQWSRIVEIIDEKKKK